MPGQLEDDNPGLQAIYTALPGEGLSLGLAVSFRPFSKFYLSLIHLQIWRATILSLDKLQGRFPGKYKKLLPASYRNPDRDSWGAAGTSNQRLLWTGSPTSSWLAEFQPSPYSTLINAIIAIIVIIIIIMIVIFYHRHHHHHNFIFFFVFAA